MKINVLLIKLPSPSLKNGKISKLPLELLVLSSAISDINFHSILEKEYKSIDSKIRIIKTSILDLSSEDTFSEIVKKISMFEIQHIVGFTSTTPQVNWLYLLTSYVKNLWPHSKIIVGGPYATLNGNELIEYKDIDYVNFGEGVESLTLFVHDVINNLPLRAPNIISKSINNFRNNHFKPKLPLDIYPKPSNSLNLINLDLYDKSGFLAHNGEIRTPIALIQLSVGCVHKCSFCSINEIYKYHRLMSIDSVIYDFISYYKNGIRLFHIVDDTFTIPVDRPFELAKILIEKKIHESIEWVFNIRADSSVLSFFKDIKGNIYNNSLNYFKFLSKSGCRGISIGVETFDRKVLESCNKGIKLSCISLLTKSAKAAGLGVKWYLMVGLPGQTWSSIYKTIRYIKKLKPTGIAVSIFIPHIGTSIYNDQRIKFLSNNYSDFISCPEPKDRYKDDVVSIIDTDKMNYEEITKARMMLINSFLQLSREN